VREVYSICGETVVTDIASNRISIFNVVDELTVAQFPAVFPRITVLFGLERENNDPEQLEGVMTLTQEDTEISRWPVNAAFGELPRMRLTLVVNGLVIPSPGIFKFALSVGDRELASWSFPVTQPELPPPQVVVAPQG